MKTNPIQRRQTKESKMKHHIIALFAFALGFLQAPAALAGAGSTPGIRIIAPADHSAVALADNPQKALDLAFETDGFEVRSHGQCEGVPNCGHVHVQIDPENTSCNYQGKPGNNTNAATGGNHITAIFALCPTPTGPHTITVSLANDDHSRVLVNGKPVISTIHVITK
jgi:hypothetical protein